MLYIPKTIRNLVIKLGRRLRSDYNEETKQFTKDICQKAKDGFIMPPFAPKQ